MKENRLEKKKLKLAGCVIVRDDKLLLLHRIRTDWYELPGGKIEVNETAEVAARRELQEELSCAVEIKEKLGEKGFEEDGSILQYEWFRAEIPPGQHIAMGEPEKFDRYSWIPLSDLDTYALSPNMKNFAEELRSGRIRMQS